MNQEKNSRPSTCTSGVRPSTNQSQKRQKSNHTNYNSEKVERKEINMTSSDAYYSPDRADKGEQNHTSNDGQQSPSSYVKPTSAYSHRKRVNSVQRSEVTSAKANSLASTMYRTFNGTYYSGTGRNTMKNSMDFSKLDPTKFVDGMYEEIPLWRQSVATWRNAAPSHKFPQTKRFADPKLPGTYKNKINIPTTIKKRSTSFGFGKNTDIFPPKHIEKASTTPAPNEHKVKRYLEDQNHYKIRYPSTEVCDNSLIQQRSGSKSGCETERGREKRSVSQNHCLTQGVEPGKTFGISYEHYRKNYLRYADRMIYSPLFQENNPPPNAYDVREKIGLEKRKHSIYQRLKMFNEYCDKQVPPVTRYKINEKQIVLTRYDDITFGYGQKINIAKPLNDNPGPQYAVKRDFDEFDKFSNHYLQF